jgi:hypothetical protein
MSLHRPDPVKKWPKKLSAIKKRGTDSFLPVHPHDHEPLQSTVSHRRPRSLRRRHPIRAPHAGGMSSYRRRVLRRTAVPCVNGRTWSPEPPTGSSHWRRPSAPSAAVPCSSASPDLPPRSAGPGPRAVGRTWSPRWPRPPVGLEAADLPTTAEQASSSSISSTRCPGLKRGAVTGCRAAPLSGVRCEVVWSDFCKKIPLICSSYSVQQYTFFIWEVRECTTRRPSILPRRSR